MASSVTGSPNHNSARLPDGEPGSAALAKRIWIAFVSALAAVLLLSAASYLMATIDGNKSADVLVIAFGCLFSLAAVLSLGKSVDRALRHLRSRLVDEMRGKIDLQALNDKLEERITERSAMAEQRGLALARSQQELKRQTQVLQSILDGMAEGVIVCDTQMRMIHFNRAAEKMLGAGVNELAPREMLAAFEILPDDENQPLPAREWPLAAVLRGQEVDDAPFRLRAASGERELWLRGSASPTRDENGVVRAGIFVFRDITEHRQADERRALLASLIESADQAMLSLNADGVVTSWNAAATSLCGYNEEEMLGQPMLRVIPEDKHVELREAAVRVMAGETVQPFAIEALRRDGVRVPIAMKISPIAGMQRKVVGYAVIATDISARRHTETQLRESEERFRMVVKSARHCAIVMLGPDGTVSSWNEGAGGMIGYNADEIIGRGFACFYPDEDVAAQKPQRDLAAARETGRHETDGWLVHKDGARFWAESVLSAITGPSGEIRSFALVLRDTTERERRTVFDTPGNPASRVKSNPQPAPAAPVRVDADQRKLMRILVIEDNPVNQRLALLQLQKLGYSADGADNAFAGLDALERKHYPIVLMDCEMPGMDGLAAAAEIRRRDGRERHTIIIAVTAHAMAGARERCLAAGMDDYLAKPVTLERLDAMLTRWNGAISLPATNRPDLPDYSDRDSIDFGVLAELRGLSSGDGEDVVSELIGLFLRDLPARLEKMEAAAAAGDVKTVASGAHSLKSSCGGLGLRRMSLLSAALEEAAIKDDSPATRIMLARVRAEAEHVSPALQEQRAPRRRELRLVSKQ